MILLVMSGKGGVGKSVVSAALAAILAESELRVGLLDADIYGPSSALLLGARGRPIEGEYGLTPPIVGGVRIMSVDLYVSGKPVPLTGVGARDLIKEILALTDWGSLDYLVVDMPPATADITLLFTSLRKEGLAALVVTTPDRLSLAVTRRVMELLRSGKTSIAGVIGNMHHRRQVAGTDDNGPRRLSAEFHAAFLGNLPYDTGLLSAAGSGKIGEVLGTRFAEALRRAIKGAL